MAGGPRTRQARSNAARKHLPVYYYYKSKTAPCLLLLGEASRNLAGPQKACDLVILILVFSSIILVVDCRFG